MKQKESSGAVTVPGRAQDNGEPNGVLNGKSSVFSHRFNVIAALTLLHCAISFAAASPSCVSLFLCFVFVQIPPKTPKFQTPLPFQSSPTSLLFPFLSQPSFHSVVCLIVTPAGPQIISYTVGSFPPHVHNWPFGFAVSVHVPSHCLFLQNTWSVSH